MNGVVLEGSKEDRNVSRDVREKKKKSNWWLLLSLLENNNV